MWSGRNALATGVALDFNIRRREYWWLPRGGYAVLADTIGSIREARLTTVTALAGTLLRDQRLSGISVIQEGNRPGDCTGHQSSRRDARQTNPRNFVSAAKLVLNRGAYRFCEARSNDCNGNLQISWIRHCATTSVVEVVRERLSHAP
jgi:hypothetical protein